MNHVQLNLFRDREREKSDVTFLEATTADGENLPETKDEDLNALTPLFTLNERPYGDIHLDLDTSSIFKVNK